MPDASFTPDMHIAIHEAKRALGGALVGGGLEDKLRVAMKATKHHWMCTDEERQLKSACAAVMLLYGTGSREYARIAQEIAQLGKLSAMINASKVGLTVGIDGLAPTDDTLEPIGLLKLWREVA